MASPTLSTTDDPAPERRRVPWWRRGSAVLLALAVETLLLLMLLGLVPGLTPLPLKQKGLATFNVGPGDVDEAARKPEVEKRAQRSGKPRPDMRVQPIQPPPPDAPEMPETRLPANVIWMTRREYAAADLGTSKASPADAPGEKSGPPDSAVAGGRGPHGETLYAAEWYVRPTHTQLATYLPQRLRQNGWGLIACRTVANYRVEDCQELGDSPRGSGLAGAVRQAAWQFRVRPPRIGGRDMVGEWVSIRIDYTYEEK